MQRIRMSILLAGSAAAGAATPQQLLQTYTEQAVRQAPGYQPSARRGAELYGRGFAVREKMPACPACHTEAPAQAGEAAP